jgi:putative transposase
MRTSKFTVEQIAQSLRRVESGVTVAEVCRDVGITETTYRWKRKYGGLGTPELRELRQLRDENRKLKQLVADLTLDRTMLRETLRKKW